MALLINVAKPAGTDAPSTLDNEQRTMRQAVVDIFGIPNNTTISNAASSFVAGGLATVNLTAASATAGTVFDLAAGHSQRDLITGVGAGLNIQADTWDVNASGNGETVAIGALAFAGIPTWTSTGTSYTVSDAATLYIQGAPLASTNVTLTRTYALWIDAGNARIDNSLYIGEQADADGDVAGLGQLWVNTATPNELWFTDDAGTDNRVPIQATSGAVTAGTNEDTYVPPDLLKYIDNLTPGADFTLTQNSVNAVTSVESGAIVNTLYLNAGNVTKPATAAFLAYNSASDTNVTGAGTVITVDFDTEVFDQGADFATDTFTAPVTGRYQLNTGVAVAGLATATGIVLKIVTSNRVYASSLFDGSAGTITDYTCMNSVLADMDAADTATITVGVYGISGDTADISGAADGRTQFSGFLAC
tara:strand:- start:16304 stop:17560 length:1257 start_codon:yes stop_codon:yes gene_type:complete